jgi:predicted phosphodiesterase
MKWSIRQTDPHAYKLEFDGIRPNDRSKVMLLSDLHWDSAQCNRDLLKRDLEEAKKEGIPVLLIGDTFDIMQGKFDKRKSAKSLRPEHQTDNYIDTVIDDAIDWFEPYKDVIALVSKGNHETSWEKYHDTDVCSRFVAGLKRAKSPVLLGKYWGFVQANLVENPKNRVSKTIFFHHGAGGGGEITRGLIDNSRTRGMYIADVYISGHIHRRNLDENIVYGINNSGVVCSRQQLFLRSSTYKIEDDGYHAEKGRGPRPLGGWWLELRYLRDRNTGVECTMRAYQT